MTAWLWRPFERLAASNRPRLLALFCVFYASCLLLTTVAPASTTSLWGPVRPGWQITKTDDASDPDVIPLWGSHDAVGGGGQTSPTRHVWHPTGGPTNGPWRELILRDGDNASGERNELGRNDWHGPTFQLFHEGEHSIVELWYRIPPQFNVYDPNWALITQFKQTQPSNQGGGVPRLSMPVFNGQWMMDTDTGIAATLPVRGTGMWTKFTWQVSWSAGARGRKQLTVEYQGHPEWWQRTPMVYGPTLKTETGGNQGIPAGASIPAHLRVGIYQNPVRGSTAVHFGGARVLKRG